MVISDENLRARIIERLSARAECLDAEQAAEKRVAEVLEALARAEKEGCKKDIYHNLVSIGNCLIMLGMPREALKYFCQAADEFPDKRVPLYAIVLTLKHLGETEEAEKYAKRFEDRFPEMNADI